MSGSLYTHNFSPARAPSPQIRNSPADDNAYLNELLAEHQKLRPFMQVLPIRSRLLNQEIMRLSGMVSNPGFGDFDRMHHGSPIPMVSSNLMANVGGSGLAGWNNLLQKKKPGLSAYVADPQMAANSLVSLLEAAENVQQHSWEKMPCS